MFGGNGLSLLCKVEAVLIDNPRMSYNAKGIFNSIYGSKKFHMKPTEIKPVIAKIRTILKRLVDNKKIRRKTRGFYQAKPSPKIIQKLENPETKLHGIKLEFSLSENNILKIHGITAQHNILDFLKANRFNLVTKKNGMNLKRWTRGVLVMDHWVTVTIHEGGLVELFCSCGDDPMCYPDFVRFGDFLSGYFQPIIVFKNREVMVRQVALGRDFWEQELSGVTSITLHKFRNDWARVYQREDGRVRYEHHLTLDMTLEDAFNSLQLLTGSPDVKYLNGKPDERRDVV